MKRVKEVFLKNKLAIMCGLLSIIVGVGLGFFVKGREVSSIQGYLYNGFGSATDSNATSSNVYQSATDSNATNSNAFNFDNSIYLSSFKFDRTEAKAGDRVYVNLTTYGSNLYGATVVLKNPKTNALISMKVQDINSGNPYVDIYPNATTANYIIKEVLLTGMNRNGTTFSRRFSNSLDNPDYNSNAFFMSFLNNLYIEGEKIATVELKSFSLLSDTCNTGEDVKIKFEATEKIDKMNLIFKSKDGKKIVGYVKDVNDSPYFKVSTLVSDGVYNLTSVTIGIDGKEVTYSKDGLDGDRLLSFDITLEVKDGDKEKLVFNSEDVNNIVVSKIEDASEDSNIIVNADSNSIIDERIFEKIKGTNRTLTINYGENEFIFKGKDIKDPKAIDVSLSISDVSKNKKISSLIGNGVILSFADNGTLPGVEKVRIKSVGVVKNVLNDKNIYVYLFNSDTSDFTLIKEDVSKNNDDYYEFLLDHNSDYVLTSSKIEESLVVRKPEIDTVVFQKSNKVHFILIGVGIVLIILLTVILILVKKKNKKEKDYDLDIKKESIENTVELKKDNEKE